MPACSDQQFKLALCRPTNRISTTVRLVACDQPVYMRALISVFLLLFTGTALLREPSKQNA